MSSGNGKDKRYVLALLSQVFPGRPQFESSFVDGKKAREDYFVKCLDKITKIKDLESIAFPYHIGCAIAGGDWETYRKHIEDFSEKLGEKTMVYIVNFNDMK